jgi:hypothetical protein
VHNLAVTKKNIQGAWHGAEIYPMNPVKVLSKLLTPFNAATPQPHSTNFTTAADSSSLPILFDNVLSKDQVSKDATTLHLANSVLNNLVHTKQVLHTLVHKFIPQLTSIAEWLLAENVILKLELQQSKTYLGSGNHVRGANSLF